MGERIRTEQLLDNTQVPEGSFYVIEAEGKVWGPFLNDVVAQLWADDMHFEIWTARMLAPPVLTVPALPSFKRPPCSTV